MEKLFIGIDWARVSDHTWVAIVNDRNDIISERIAGVRGDSTGQGDMPMEFLQAHSGLPSDSTAA